MREVPVDNCSRAARITLDWACRWTRLRPEALAYYDLAAARGSKTARHNAANLRSPDYDRPPGAGGGGFSSRDSDFQQFQCIGAGGRWNGSNCLAGPKSNTIINP